MRLLKKGLSVMLLSALLLTAGAACGKKEAGNAEKTSGAASGNSNQEKTMDVVTVWTSEGHSKSVIERLVKEFNSSVGAEKGIEIQYEVKTDISKLVELGATTGDLPDIFSGGSMSQLAENGVIIALEDIEGGEALVDKYRDYLLVNTHTYKGKTYKLPFSATLHGLLYNKDMFKAAGLVDKDGEPTPPKTFEELREYAKILTDESKQEYGLVVPIGWGVNSFLDSVVPMARVSTGLQNGYNPKTGEYDFTSMNAAVQTLLDIKNDGSIVPGADGMDNDTARARFAAGGIGMKFGYSFDVGVLTDQFPAEIDWGVAPIPAEDEEHMYKQPYNLGFFAAINSKSVERVGAEKILTVYEFLHSDAFLKELYEEGMYIPYKAQIVENATYSGDKKGWAEFTSMLDISDKNLPTMPYQSSPDLKLPAECWVDDIWTQKVSYEQFAEEVTKKVNESVIEYQKAYPDEDYSIYVNADYHSER